MCTVTYIPSGAKNSFILTSNRDEKVFRPTLPPEIYTYENCRLIFPKDKKAGGSWIAMNDKGNVNCLLNGGIIAHEKQKHHTISRGNVLIEFTRSALKVQDYFSGVELGKVEPFTIVALSHENGIVNDLTEFIWDGADKHYRKLDINRPYIWSSVTLYSPQHRKGLKESFEQFYMEYKKTISKETIFRFHSGDDSIENPIKIIRHHDDGLRTVSITQVTSANKNPVFSYFDLLNDSVTESAF